MRGATLFKTASVVFVLFAAGHTFGFLGFTPPTAAGIAVRDAMNTVHFTVGSTTFSYGGFYRGLGFSVTAAMLFQAFLAWQLAAISARPAARIAWGLCALQVVGFALSLVYFALPPAVFSLALAACLGFAARSAQSAKA